ncbi:MAG: diguanylate cyclase [Candidatus Schekmanbacteria bacterium]|nr:diguanylate cyclase [Candidatus Schekmanbacteria bacterium]
MAILTEQAMAEVLEILGEMPAGFDVAEVLQRLSRWIAVLLRADRCSIVISEGDRYRVVATSDCAEAARHVLLPERYPEIAHVLVSGEPLRIDDLLDHPVLSAVREHIEPSGYRAALVVPVCGPGRGAAVTARLSGRARTFSSDDEQVLRALARLVAAPVALLKLHQESRVERRRMLEVFSQRSAQLEAENRDLRRWAVRNAELLGSLSQELAAQLGLIRRRLDRLAESSLAPGVATEIGHVAISLEELRNHVSRTVEVDRLDCAELRPVPVDLADLVAELCAGLQLRARANGLSLHLRPHDPVTVIEADALKVTRAIVAAISHAIDCTPPGGQVAVSLKTVHDLTTEPPARSFVRLQITDTGPGLPAGLLDELFDPTNSPLRPAPSAVGLGLPMVREVLELHGGRLEVKRQRDGVTALRLLFPIAPAGAHSEPAAAAAPARPAEHADGLDKVLILIVEDDDDARNLLSWCLGDRYRLATAVTGPDGLAKTRLLRPDLVLLDLFLPGLSGQQLLTEMRADPELHDTPVIVLTASSNTEHKVWSFRTGADDYITKPFIREELTARIDAALRMRRLTTQLKSANRKLSEISVRDELTGLHNYRYFRQRLREEHGRAGRAGATLACLMIDLDNLKQINDRYGHVAGNRVLEAVGDTLRQQVRQSDVVARYGGDEFVVLLAVADAATAVELGNRIVELFRRIEVAADGTGDSEDAAATTAPGGADTIRATASVGVAVVTGTALPQDPEDLVRMADEAVYRAKSEGRDRVVLVGDPRWSGSESAS